MRVLHVPYSFPPDPAGGTEVYVRDLAAAQNELGCTAAVAAPAAKADRYEYNGLPVWRFAAEPRLSLRQLYGEGDPMAAEGFDRILDDFQPEVVHLHGMTCAISVLLAEKAAGRGLPIVFNYHTPTVSCLRGTLLHDGREICDGVLDLRRCSACVLTGKGVAGPSAALLALVPPAIGRALGAAGLSGGVWTVLRMTELTSLRMEMFRRMMALSDRILALCNWTRELLVRNAIPETRIALCRQGIGFEPRTAPEGPPGRPAVRLPLRLAFLGRLDATKGAHVVVAALRADPSLPIRLDLYGVSQGEAGSRYAAELRTLMADDARIRLLPPVSSSGVIPLLASYDALVVPSQWLETGPLVVLEAFAAGTPVIGSDLGGIAELVSGGTDGLLVRSWSSPEAWAAAFRRICAEPGLVDALRAGIRPPRRTSQAAREIVSVYESLTGSPHRTPTR